jgi:hypothetical protein
LEEIMLQLALVLFTALTYSERATVCAPLTVDLGVDTIRTPGLAVTPGSSVVPVVRVRNFGTTAQANIPVRCWIDSAGVRIYSRTYTLAGPLAPNDTARVTFLSWTAGPHGTVYSLRAFTDLSGDLNRANDTSRLTFSAFQVHDTLFAGWAVVKPVLDGELQTEEWRDAIRYDISDVLGQGGLPQLPGSAWLLVKHDSAAVYYGLDMPVTPYREHMCLAAAYMDEDNDRAWRADSFEGNHFFMALSGGVDTVWYRPILPGPVFGNTNASPGMGHCRWSRAAGHLQCEASVSKGNAKWDHSLSPGADTVGLLFYASDTVARRASWPTRLPVAGFLDPAQYGRVILLAKQLPDVAVAEIPYPAGNIDTVTAIFPQVRLRNNGAALAVPTATFDIYGIGGIAIYSQTLTLTLAPGQDSTLTFPEWPRPHMPGQYTTRCSTACPFDTIPANDIAFGAFAIHAVAADTGWQQLSPVPPGARNKRVKDGGCLSYLEEPLNGVSYVYLLKGANRLEFYRYNTITSAWEPRESIPAYGSSGKKKAVKKGGTITTDAANQKLYAAKGGNTREWWMYDPALSQSGTYPWIQKPDVPTGAVAIKEGNGSTALRIADTTWIYLLKCGSTQEFYAYNTSTDTWRTLAPAPLGPSGRGFKKGSSLAAHAGKVYCLKGNYNELYVYDPATNTWASRVALPFYGNSGRKKKAGDGSAMDSDGIVSLYALKGGNTLEFWQYRDDSNRWRQRADMPAGAGRQVRGGGDIAFIRNLGIFCATKGSSTDEFYRYLPSPVEWGYCRPGCVPTTAVATVSPQALALDAVPNPFTRATSIRYTLPLPGNATLKLYSITGRLITTLASGYHNAGSYRLALGHRSLDTGHSLPARGVYLLRLQSSTCSATRKLIIQ